VDVPYDWGLGISDKPMDVHIFSRYVNVLCALADYASLSGDVKAATEYLINAERLVDAVIDEPNNKALITWTSCAQRVVKGAYSMLEQNPTPEGIEAAKRLLEGIKPPTDLKQAVRNECLVFQVSARKYDAMSYIQRSNLQLGPAIERIEPPTGANASGAIESRSLQFWIDASNAAVPEDGDLKSVGKTLDDMCRDWTEDRQLASYLSLGLTPIFEQTGTAIMRVEQMKRIVGAAIEALAHYVETGRLPESLSGHTDPITGERLRYTPSDGSFIVQAAAGSKGVAPFGDLQLVPGHGYAVTFDLPR
jgi:hypothetical protein